MSQLGMMVIAAGLSSYNIALFHLINHAFYKGLLFLGAGAVIHAVAYNQANAAHEGDIFMSMPLIILALFSIFFGYITKDIFIGLGSSFFSDNGLFIHPLHEITLDTEFAVPTVFKLLPLFFTIILSIISIIFTEFYPKLLIKFKLSTIVYIIRFHKC